MTIYLFRFKNLQIALLCLVICEFANSFLSHITPTHRIQSLYAEDGTGEERKKKVVVIGGGWAGFSAADVLSSSVSTENGKSVLDIVLLDASPRGPGGLAGGWRTSKLNRPVEAGLHGFWREYRNTFAAIERIGLDLDDILTPYTPSMLVSKSGKVALAPVLGKTNDENANSEIKLNNLDFSNPSGVISKLGLLDLSNPSSLLSRFADLLPPPLDVALLSDFNDDNPLDITDRVSALGLLGAWADFGQEDTESWDRYDKISAENLFRSVAGVSPTLYDELVSPLLHVLPMTPGYDCSAAAALSCFHVFALQAKGAFDVRWCRGTISEKIFNPWVQKLQATGNVTIRGGAKITAIEEREQGSERKFKVTINGDEKIECDAIVLAIGGTAIKKLTEASPPLAKLSIANKWKQFRGVTCVAVRLFFRASVSLDGDYEKIPGFASAMKESPVVVCGPGIGGISELVETGFCIYDLQRLQDDFDLERNGGTSESILGIEVDFFRANSLAKIPNNLDVVRIALRAISAALEIDPIDEKNLLDVSVVRAKDAVSHFCVNSASWSPGVKLSDGLYMCGDWIDRKGHASWSTEKSVVTARQAASALAYDFGLECEGGVIPAAADTPQLKTLRRIAKLTRSLLPSDVLPQAPWVLAKQITGGQA